MSVNLLPNGRLSDELADGAVPHALFSESVSRGMDTVVPQEVALGPFIVQSPSNVKSPYNGFR
jgi:hypothetical protein